MILISNGVSNNGGATLNGKIVSSNNEISLFFSVYSNLLFLSKLRWLGIFFRIDC